MRVLVTGGAGFIGSHIVEQLLREKDVQEIRVVDNLATGRMDNLQPFLSRIQLIQGDLADAAVCAKAAAGIDVIFHEAAIPSVPRSVDNPLENHLNGAHITILLLEAARKAGVRRVVFAGSSSAYGDSETLPKHEGMLPQPLSPYAATKLAAEHYLAAYAKCYPLDTAVLRYFNIFGPRQDPSSPYSGVIAKFCTAYCRNEPITIFGDGEQSRDFTFVTNAVQANIRAARCPQPLRGQVFNVGCGERFSLNQMVVALNELTGQNRVAEYKPARAGDVKHSLADITRARTILGYEPTVSFKDGLAQTLAWYRTQLAAR